MNTCFRIGLLALAALTTTVQANDALKAAIAAPHRSAANVARDAARHPYETLSFFGIEPHHTVIELTPSGGWYTEILAPYLRDKGQLILAADDPGSAVPYRQRAAANLAKKLASQPAIYDKVKVAVFEPPQKLNFAAAGSADAIVTFRNVHNWVADGEATTRTTFASLFAALKSGGVLGVVDHRLPDSRPQDATASSGYLHTQYVIDMAQSVGFKWVASAEINANPKDTADHPSGVWALPPSFANKDDRRAHYAAIGESDRFTLKFIKP